MRLKLLTLAVVLVAVAAYKSLYNNELAWAKPVRDGKSAQKNNLTAKQAFIAKVRKHMASRRRGLHYSYRHRSKPKVRAEINKRLGKDGIFSNLNLNKLDERQYNGGVQGELAHKITAALIETRLLAQGIFDQPGLYRNDATRAKIFAAINYYGGKELRRIPGWFRFHNSCFMIPKVAIELYFVFYEDMVAAESGKKVSPAVMQANKTLRQLAFQAFSQPLRGKIDPVSIDNFRGSGWFTGGNFGYRPLFSAAVVNNDVKMFDVLAEVTVKALGVASYNTFDKAFWIEGLTADGSGWGHGRQVYVYGYPAHGLIEVLSMLGKFQNTPWLDKATPKMLKNAANFAIRGLAWYQYRGIPAFTANGRSNWIPARISNVKKFGPPPLLDRIGHMLLHFDLKSSQKRKIIKLLKLIKKGNFAISGNRYFWNQDDMIQRGSDYFVIAAMCSKRSNGPEVVPGISPYNHYVGDGSLIVLRRGDEVTATSGAWNPDAIPGVTCRQGKLPNNVKLWNGYTGKSNFAGGVSDGKVGVCGFIYEKASCGQNVPGMLGVSARKGYFMFSNVIVCLGANIKNATPEVPGDICTTINQTLRKGNFVWSNDKVKSQLADGKYGNGKFSSPNIIADASWFFNNGVGYVVLPGKTSGKILWSIEKRRTDWQKFCKQFNKNRKDYDVDVLQISINHGKKIKNGRYAYCILPRVKTAGQVKRFAEKPTVSVLRNNSKLQAVYKKASRTAQMIFYRKNYTCKVAGYSISVNKPAVVMVKFYKSGKIKIKLADPTQNPKAGHITVKISKRGRSKSVKVKLPEKPLCGKNATAYTRF